MPSSDGAGVRGLCYRPPGCGLKSGSCLCLWYLFPLEDAPKTYVPNVNTLEVMKHHDTSSIYRVLNQLELIFRNIVGFFKGACINFEPHFRDSDSISKNVQ